MKRMYTQRFLLVSFHYVGALSREQQCAGITKIHFTFCTTPYSHSVQTESGEDNAVST